MGLGTCRLLQCWDLTSVDLYWWLGENNAWRVMRPVPGVSTVKAGPLPTTVHFVVWSMNSSNCNRTHSHENSLNEKTQWSFTPSMSAPIPPTSHHRPESQPRSKFGNFYSKNQSRPAWQGNEICRAKGRSYQYPGQALITNQTPYQGANGTNLSVPTLPTEGRLRSKRNWRSYSLRKGDHAEAWQNEMTKIARLQIKEKGKTYENN